MAVLTFLEIPTSAAVSLMALRATPTYWRAAPDDAINDWDCQDGRFPPRSCTLQSGATADHQSRCRGENSHRWPHFLPDGRHFLFTIRSSIKDNTGLYIGSLVFATNAYESTITSAIARAAQTSESQIIHLQRKLEIEEWSATTQRIQPTSEQAGGPTGSRAVSRG
jgi:hypothetical protein